MQPNPIIAKINALRLPWEKSSLKISCYFQDTAQSTQAVTQKTKIRPIWSLCIW
jgi:hypothetical protein